MVQLLIYHYFWKHGSQSLWDTREGTEKQVEVVLIIPIQTEKFIIDKKIYAEDLSNGSGLEYFNLNWFLDFFEYKFIIKSCVRSEIKM